MDEINLLVAEYNTVEAQQSERLKRLFELVDARQGYRRITFSTGGDWSNCWGWEPRLALPRFVYSHEHKIIGVELSEPV